MAEGSIADGGRRLKMPNVPQLDGVRAVAVGIVFVSHVGFGKIVPGGLGVTIFFFLSGYLITSLLRAEASQTGKVSLPAFYVRRTLRIMPPLYITLAFAGAMAAVGLLRVKLEAAPVIAQALFYSNYERLWGTHHGFPIGLWSLAVEEHFYLIFPALFAGLLMRRSARDAARICLIACGVVLAIRLLQGLWPAGLHVNYYLTHTRADSILFGCALALWNNPVLDGERAWKPKWYHFALSSLAIIAAALVRNPYFGETLRYSIQSACLYVVFSYILHGAWWSSAILNSRPMQLIGKFSYTIYLIHTVIIVILRQNFQLKGVMLILWATLLTLAYSGAMYLFVERPLARLRRKLHREQAPRPPMETVQALR